MRYSADLAIQVSHIWPQRDVTRRQTNEGSGIVYMTEKAAHKRAQNVIFGLFAAAWLFGRFHIHLFIHLRI